MLIRLSVCHQGDLGLGIAVDLMGVAAIVVDRPGDTEWLTATLPDTGTLLLPSLSPKSFRRDAQRMSSAGWCPRPDVSTDRDRCVIDRWDGWALGCTS